MAKITINVPDQEALEIDLDSYEQISLGRGPDNDVVLDHVSMSGSHAVIQNLDGAFQITDLSSTNGTFVNDEAISESILGHGDRILFGSVSAVFEEEDEAAGAEGGVGDAAETAGEGSGYAMHYAEVAEVSNHPEQFKNLSPIEKIEKKDVLGQLAYIVGIVAILAAGGVVAAAAMMTV
ncbi:MAG: FHA domain-containing protein [Verrucomicrobiales bacterium]